MSDVDERLSTMRLKIEHGVWGDGGSRRHKGGPRGAEKTQPVSD